MKSKKQRAARPNNPNGGRLSILNNKTKKAKKKIVPELPKIEDIELPGLSGRGVLVLGLLKNLIPGLKITPKKGSSWIQAFNRMGAAEISRIIALSQSEIYCRRAIEQAVKETEK